MGQYLSTDFFTDIQKNPIVSPLNPAPPPVSGKGGLIALRNAEYIDQYRKKIEESSVNTIARRNQEYMPVYLAPSPPILHGQMEKLSGWTQAPMVDYPIHVHPTISASPSISLTPFFLLRSFMNVSILASAHALKNGKPFSKLRGI